MKTKSFVYVLTGALVFLLCAAPQDPRKDPANARIDEARSGNSLPAKITAYHEYSCTLFVVLPELIDSIRAECRQGASDTPLCSFSNLEEKDSILVFSFAIAFQGPSSLLAYAYREDRTVDTLIIPLSIRYPPNVTPDSANYHTFVKTAVDVRFNITDPDGDIRSCEVYIDSTTGQAITTNLSGTNASVARSVSGPSFDTMVVFARAFDSAGNASSMVPCTVFVLDTAKPVLSLIRIIPSTGDTVVRTLPCDITVRILDDSPVDSAQFADSTGKPIQPMSVSRDSAHVLVASLDSGKHSYRVLAWDKAGNRGTMALPILYTGAMAYKFTFANIVDRSVNENGKFPSISLDNCISISPTAGIPAAWKDSIRWKVLEIKPDSGIKATVIQATRTVAFAVPDSEWNGSESFTFIAEWPDMATGYAGAAYTVIPINDPPRITWNGQRKPRLEGWDTVFADKCAFDPDNPASSLLWTQDTTAGKFFTLQWVYTYVSHPPFPPLPIWTHKWAIVTKPKVLLIKGWVGKDTLRLTVKDPGGLSHTAPIPLEKY